MQQKYTYTNLLLLEWGEGAPCNCPVGAEGGAGATPGMVPTPAMGPTVGAMYDAGGV